MTNERPNSPSIQHFVKKTVEVGLGECLGGGQNLPGDAFIQKASCP